MQKCPEAYCFMICHRIGRFIQDNFGVEVVQMRAEFYLSEIGLVKLYNAEDIWVRQ